MARLLLIRTLTALLSLLVVSFVIFWCVEWLPGDTATRILGRNATQSALAQLRQELNLDQPPMVRYWTWLSSFVIGDFGTSLTAGRPVVDYIWQRAVNTLTLTGFALALYFPLSIALGVITAMKRGTKVDNVLSVLVLVGMCLPEFVVGILLISVFAVGLGWFPPLALVDQARSFGELVQLLTLPTLTLVAAMTAYAVRMMRESLIEVLESNYVTMARLRGLSPARVILMHALPNALGPALNITTMNIAWLIGGVVLVEAVFDFPGLGRLMVDAISLKDIPVIQTVAMLMTAVYILSNLAADLLAMVFNPKLR
ncbi:ABC transporter permease [Rhodoligotrophos defluvii]|uniref:ABC transporter permease n=1 Tax=Rhodoligotrophos defluvii TaxID=2561934 RepID=UPI0010C9D831|nr:ABC transporter permease [Rhodoligotrophos defluvii]